MSNIIIPIITGIVCLAVGVIIVIVVVSVVPVNDSAAALAGSVVIVVAELQSGILSVPALSSAQILSPQCSQVTVSLW